MHQPSIDVVIPTYNAARTLRETLQSLQAQSFTNWHAFVVDDCSTDDTRIIVQSFIDDDSRFNLVSTERNSGGPATPRNIGVKASNADYIAFLDQDDMWQSDKLSRHFQALLDYSPISLSFSLMLPRVEGNPTQSLYLALRTLLACRTREVLLSRGNFIHCSSVVANRNAVISAGCFPEDEALIAAEDYALWVRLALSGPIHFIPQITGTYRIHSGSTSTGRDIKKLNSIAQQPSTETESRFQSRRCTLSAYAESIIAILVNRLKSGSYPRVVLI